MRFTVITSVKQFKQHQCSSFSLFWRNPCMKQHMSYSPSYTRQHSHEHIQSCHTNAHSHSHMDSKWQRVDCWAAPIFVSHLHPMIAVTLRSLALHQKMSRLAISFIYLGEVPKIPNSSQTYVCRHVYLSVCRHVSRCVCLRSSAAFCVFARTRWRRIYKLILLQCVFL